MLTFAPQVRFVAAGKPGEESPGNTERRAS